MTSIPSVWPLAKQTLNMSSPHYGIEKGLCSCRQEPVITAQHERHECGQPIWNYTCICKSSYSMATKEEIPDKNFVLAEVRTKDRGVICNICIDTTPLLSPFSQLWKYILETLLLVEYYWQM